MAASDKDRFQKKMALEFCLQQDIIPYIEVPVLERLQLQSSPLLITDLDVLGIGMSWTGRLQRTLFDCKTSKDSPINRAIWSSGIISHAGLDDAYVILKRTALPTHKVTAESKDVYLFDSESFAQFMRFHELNPDITSSYVTDILALDEVLNSLGKETMLAAYQQACHRSPLERDHARGIRSVIGSTISVGAEIDPTRGVHNYIVGELAASLSIHLQVAISSFIRMVDARTKRQDVESIVRYYVWGGYDRYSAKQRLTQIKQDTEVELELPSWPMFVKMVGVMMGATNTLRRVPIVARSLAIRSCVGKIDEYDETIREYVKQDKRAVQNFVLILRYLRDVGKFPAEVVENYEESIAEIMR